MATISAAQAFYLGNASGLPPKIVGGIGIPGFIREAASQTYAAGDPVQLAAASGKVTEQADGDNVADLWGIALEKATGVTDTPVLVRLFQAGDLYVMNKEATGAQTSTPNIVDVGAPVEFNISGGNLYCDENSVPAAGSAADRPQGVIRAIYCKEHGYPTATLLGDTFAQVVVELQGGAHWRSPIS